MAAEIFAVSVVFWIAVLIIFLHLNRQLATLAGKVTELENRERE